MKFSQNDIERVNQQGSPDYTRLVNIVVDGGIKEWPLKKIQDGRDGCSQDYESPFTWHPELLYHLARAGIVTVDGAMNLPARTVWEMYHEHSDWLRQN